MLNRATGKRLRVHDLIALDPTSQPSTPEPPRGNTTLTVLVTNRKLDGHTLRQVARQVHSSMSRAIEPFHTMTDGDVLFAVTTNEVAEEQPNAYRMGVLASELAWDAVLNCFEA